jgi:hypothetical protein
MLRTDPRPNRTATLDVPESRSTEQDSAYNIAHVLAVRGER